MWYIGCEDSMVLTKVALPDADSSFPFHPGNLAPILSKVVPLSSGAFGYEGEVPGTSLGIYRFFRGNFGVDEVPQRCLVSVF